MKTYCIFQVHDYKGVGELSSSINLKPDEIAGELGVIFEYCFEDIPDCSELSIKEIKERLQDAVESEYFLSTYAGGEGFCGELYEVKDGKLKETSYSKYIKDMTKHIKNNWDY